MSKIRLKSAKEEQVKTKKILSSIMNVLDDRDKASMKLKISNKNLITHNRKTQAK